MPSRKKPQARPTFRPQLEALCGHLCGGTALGERPTVRPGVEALEERVALASYTWTGGVSSDFNTAGNWTGGPAGTVPGPNDDITYDINVSNNTCVITGMVSVHNLTMKWTGTIDISAPIILGTPPLQTEVLSSLFVTGTADLAGGAIDQEDPTSILSLGGGGTWWSTYLNTTANLSTVYVGGNLTVKLGADTLGSNFFIQNNATVDWQRTNRPVTVKNGADITVAAGSTLNFSGDNALGVFSTEIKTTSANSYLDIYGTVQRTGNPSTELVHMPAKVESGGRLWVQAGCWMELDGANASTKNSSLYQVGGTTDIGTAGNDTNATLQLTGNALATDGVFETLGKNGTLQFLNPGCLTIDGTANVKISAGAINTYGTFNVTGGSVNFEAGTLTIYCNVNTTTYDVLKADSGVTINSAVGGATLDVHTVGTPVGDITLAIIQAPDGQTVSDKFAAYNWNGGFNWVPKTDTFKFPDDKMYRVFGLNSKP